MKYIPATRKEALESIDEKELIEGYFDGKENAPEPMGNRSWSYWHGWRNGMSDAGHREIDEFQRQLAHEAVSRGKD